MNNSYKIGLTLLIILLIVFFIFFRVTIKIVPCNQVEGMDTSNEAIANIASLYAEGDMKITNLNNTEKIKTKDLDASNKLTSKLIETPSLKATSANITNATIANITNHATFKNSTNFKGGSNNRWGGTHFPFTDGKNYIRGNLEIRGDNTWNTGHMHVKGALNANGGLAERVIILDHQPWDHNKWNIAMAGHMRGTPIGTLKKFLIVHRHGNKDYVHLRHFHAIKFHNNQAIVYELHPQHTNTRLSSSNSGTWRINL